MTRFQRQAAALWYYGVCVLLLGSAALTPEYSLAMMLHMPMEELARKADTIVLGTVAQQVAAWNEHHTAIYSDITVVVEHTIAGTPSVEVTFRSAGGIVDGVGMRTSNDPIFVDGERLVIFLDTTVTPATVVGLHQGKYTVSQDRVLYEGQSHTLQDFLSIVRAAAH